MRSAVDKNSREYLENKMKSARHSLLLVLIFTVVNLVLLMADGNTYFLFSASVPFYLTVFGIGMDAGAGGSVFTTTALVISAIILAAYLLCWIFSKKKVGWYVAALVLFIIDTVLLVLLALAFETLADSIMDLVFHGWVVLELSQALICHKKLKALPPEPEAEPVPAPWPPSPASDDPWNAPGQ